jgi:hypothetical protein
MAIAWIAAGLLFFKRGSWTASGYNFHFLFAIKNHFLESGAAQWGRKANF